MSAWPGTVAARMAFERGARRAYPSLRSRRPRRRGEIAFRYTARIDVPFYEARQVTIEFRQRSSTPLVTVDGPTDSPHRYEDGALCMWVPADAAAQRWVFEHGLLDLLDTIRAHLFREAWWRETKDATGDGEWLGPELGHQATRPAATDPKEAA